MRQLIKIINKFSVKRANFALFVPTEVRMAQSCDKFLNTAPDILMTSLARVAKCRRPLTLYVHKQKGFD
jgi:hypothetical protein